MDFNLVARLDSVFKYRVPRVGVAWTRDVGATALRIGRWSLKVAQMARTMLVGGGTRLGKNRGTMSPHCLDFRRLSFCVLFLLGVDNGVVKCVFFFFSFFVYNNFEIKETKLCFRSWKALQLSNYEGKKNVHLLKKIVYFFKYNKKNWINYRSFPYYYLSINSIG